MGANSDAGQSDVAEDGDVEGGLGPGGGRVRNGGVRMVSIAPGATEEDGGKVVEGVARRTSGYSIRISSESSIKHRLKVAPVYAPTTPTTHHDDDDDTTMTATTTTTTTTTTNATPSWWWW